MGYDTCFGVKKYFFIGLCVLAGIGLVIGVVGGIIYGVNLAKMDYLESSCYVEDYYIYVSRCSRQSCTGSGNNRNCRTIYYDCYSLYWDVSYEVEVPAPPTSLPIRSPAPAPTDVSPSPTDASPSPTDASPSPSPSPTPTIVPTRPPTTKKLVYSSIYGGQYDYYSSVTSQANAHPIYDFSPCWYDPDIPSTVQWEQPDPGPGMITMIVGFVLFGCAILPVAGIVVYHKMSN